MAFTTFEEKRLRQILETYLISGKKVGATGAGGAFDVSLIVNALNETTGGKVLDARQGKALADLVASLTTTVGGKLAQSQADSLYKAIGYAPTKTDVGLGWVPGTDPGYQTAAQVTAVTGPIATSVAGNTSSITSLGTNKLDASTYATNRTSDQTSAANASNLAAGTVPLARIGTGTPAAGKYMDGATGAWTTLPTSVPTQIIDVAATYGIVAGSTDNATNLMNMQTALAGYGKPKYILLFPAGTVCSSNTRWTQNIVYYDIVGGGLGGTVFKAIYSGTDEKFQRGILWGDPFQNNNLTYTGTQTYAKRYSLNPTTRGNKTVTLTTTADATDFSAGKRILIFSFDQIGAQYPPGSRYNEWHVIESVNTGTGVLTLRTPLKYDLDANLWDGTTVAAEKVGQPRCILLDRTDFIYPIRAGLYNITLELPVGAAAGASSSYCPMGEFVYAENVIVNGHFWPAETKKMVCESVQVIASSAVSASEIDKVGGDLVLNNCLFNNAVSNGTGWESITGRNTIFGQTVQLCARFIDLDGCTSRADSYPDTGVAALGNAPAATPIRRYRIKNHTFLKSSANTATSACDVVTWKEHTVVAISGTSIVIPVPATNNFSGNALVSTVYTMEKNFTRLYKTDGSKMGIVTGFSYDATYNSGQGAIVIAGSWAAPVVGEVWRWKNVIDFIDEGGHTFDAGFTTTYSDDCAMFTNSATVGSIKTTRLNLRNFNLTGSGRNICVGGRILNIRVNVVKAYGGSDSAKLYFHGFGDEDIISINPKVVGTRQVGKLVTTTLLSGDSNDATNGSGLLDTFVSKLSWFCRASGIAWASQTADMLPEIYIEIQWISQT